ncbi:helix-turn-helix domain-containing protein [Paenibacillus sp. FSL H8-0034]|uniref:helix-turn-helix domain-containing protein n=1 Tax=Paenibacillus sp. FSL H8-0034 TaxID=2954671 RepID=UPI0030FC9D22
MKNHYLYRLIWFGCLSACLPIILSGVAYYQYSMNVGISRIQENNQMSLNMIEQYTEKLMRNIEDNALQLALDPEVVNSFSFPDYQTNYVSQRELLRKITLHKSNNSFIGDLFYYNQSIKMVLSNELGFQRFEDFKYKNDIELLEARNLNGQWIYVPGGTSGGYITYVLKLPTLSSGESQGLLVTEVDIAQITKYYANLLTLTRSQSIFVIDPKQQLLFQSQKTSGDQAVISESVMNTIFMDKSKSNNLFDRSSDGTKLNYSYLKSASGNVYVSAIPNQIILEELSWIRWVALLAVLTFIAVGTLLTVFTLKRAYTPIQKLVDYLDNESKTMGQLWSSSISPLKERLLQQWLGTNYIDSSTLNDECIKYGIPLDRIYVVLLVKVENAFKEGRFQPQDKSVLTFAIVNVMKELLSDHRKLQGFVLHDQQGQGTVILHFDRNLSTESAIDLSRQFAESVRSAMLQYLKLQSSIGIGRLYPHIADIRLSYHEANRALQSRLFKEVEAILYIDDLENPHNSKTFKYPFSIEKRIVESFADGNLQHAREAMQEFMNALGHSESLYMVSQSYYLLLASIVTSLENKGGGVSGMLEYELFNTFQQQETGEEIFSWFMDTLFPLYGKIADENYNTTGKQTISKVRAYLLDNISHNISLTECADLFNIASPYLSSLFKQEVGISFLHFITECKINEAQKLLVETDQSISQIASAVGYSPRTFNRVFKQRVGTSPSEHRALYR